MVLSGYRISEIVTIIIKRAMMILNILEHINCHLIAYWKWLKCYIVLCVLHSKKVSHQILLRCGSIRQCLISNYSTHLHNHWVFMKHTAAQQSRETESHPVSPQILEECHVSEIFFYFFWMSGKYYFASKNFAVCPRPSCARIILMQIQTDD